MSLSMIVSSSIRVAATLLISFISWLSNIPLYIITTSSLSMFSIQGHLDCSKIQALVNKAALNFLVPVCCRFMVFPRYTPRSGNAVCSVAVFFRKRHTLLQVAVSNLHSHHQGSRVPFSPCSLLHFWFLEFLRMAILTGAK